MPFGPDDLKKASEDIPLGAYRKVSNDGSLVGGQPKRPDHSIGALPYLALAAGNGLDAGSSAYNFSRGYQEQNPMYTWMGPQPTAGIAAIDGLKTALMSWQMHKLADSGHPAAAKAMGYVGGALGALPGIYNMTRPDLKK